MKKIFLTAVLALFLFIPSTATAWSSDFGITITNDTEKGIYYWFYWIDHELRYRSPSPMNLMGGELMPGKSVTNKDAFTYGKYLFKWGYIHNDDDRSRGVGMNISKGVKEVMLSVQEHGARITSE